MTAMRPTQATHDLVFQRDEGCCAYCAIPVFGVRGFDYSLHHRRPSGMGGDRRPETHAAGNLVLLHGHGSVGCHFEVESARMDSLASGLLISKNAVGIPASFVIDHAVHGRVYLNDEGGFTRDPKQVAA